MKGKRLLLFDKSLNNWDRFGLVWNAAWFVWCAYFGVTFHDWFLMVMMVVFGVFFYLALRTSLMKRRGAQQIAQINAALEAARAKEETK